MSLRFADIFAASPFTSLQGHMGKAMEGVRHLSVTLEAVLDQHWDRAQQGYVLIMACEREADHLKKNIRLHLPHSLFMPVPRHDLLELLSVQDKMVNQAKDIATLFLERRMVLPSEVHAPFRALLQMSICACEQAHSAVEQLDALVETGFKGHEVRVMENIIQDLDHLEEQSDGLQRKAHAALFAIEKNHPPVDVMFFYRAIDNTAQLANWAQRVGHRLQLLLAR